MSESRHPRIIWVDSVDEITQEDIDRARKEFSSKPFSWESHIKEWENNFTPPEKPKD